VSPASRTGNLLAADEMADLAHGTAPGRCRPLFRALGLF